MPKKVRAVVKLEIEAAKATPAPPVGPGLAQHGINIAEFCQRFNEATKDRPGFKLPVEIRVFEDGTYDFRLKKPAVSGLLKRAAGIEKGSGEPKRIRVGKITKEQLREIAREKMADLNTTDLEKAMKTIAGTAKNMGLEIE